jgi:hypothetical protein
MNDFSHRGVRCLGLAIVICGLSSLRAMGGACVFSDASSVPSENGCMLAFAYNQQDDCRLVVLDEKNRHRYEAPLKGPSVAPFWEGGKVYILGPDSKVQGFKVGPDRLIADEAETICAGVLRHAEYVRSQHRLYVIQTVWNDQQHAFVYDLMAIDFPARKILWTKRIDDPGLLKVMPPYVCMTGLQRVQAFNCETGEKLGGIEAGQVAACRQSQTGTSDLKPSSP